MGPWRNYAKNRPEWRSASDVQEMQAYALLRYVKVVLWQLTATGGDSWCLADRSCFAYAKCFLPKVRVAQI